MPIYEYNCAACGHDLEALQKIGDAPLVDCPACGKPELRKRLSAAAFRLKGSGWYETDFKNPDKNKKAKKSKDGEKKNTDSKNDKSSKPKSGTSSTGTTGSSD